MWAWAWDCNGSRACEWWADIAGATALEEEFEASVTEDSCCESVEMRLENSTFVTLGVKSWRRFEIP